jgi:hypothetical protein
VSWIRRTYTSSIVVSFVLLGWWALWTLRDNQSVISVVLWVPQLDWAEPLVRRHFFPEASLLLAGWLCAVGLALFAAFRLPFRLRTSARLLRRVRELEREVLELRTLPLRQQEADEQLEHEAQLETRAKRVMTEQLSLVSGKRPGSTSTDLPINGDRIEERS